MHIERLFDRLCIYSPPFHRLALIFYFPDNGLVATLSANDLGICHD